MKRMVFGVAVALSAAWLAHAVGVTLVARCFEKATFENIWKAPLGEWQIVADVFTDPADDKKLGSKPGDGVAVNGPNGKTNHLVTNKEFGDVDLTVDFMVPKGSNSGIYLQGRYEIQILDSFGVEAPTYTDCGGIYQRWKEDPGIDDSQRGYEGHAPLSNASKKPGEWQTFHIIFRAPKFDSNGNKVANAKFEKVWLNDVLVQDNIEVTGPTRASMSNDEKPTGPLMLQGDHGPIAYRNLRVVIPEHVY